MIITNMLLASIAFLLFCILMTIGTLKVEVKLDLKKKDPVSDAIKEADENERWG